MRAAKRCPLAAALAVAAALAGAAGCQTASTRAPTERLDRSTGVTFTTASAPVVFARTESRFSRSARDYLYLGPVETNRRGLREYFLWIGVATTLDRGYLAPEIPPPGSLQIMVRGEPMELALRPWAELVPGSPPADLYRSPVAPRALLGARVTRDQLRLLAEAAPASVLARASDGSVRRYDAWPRAAAWPMLAAPGD